MSMKAVKVSNLKYYLLMHFVVLAWGFTGLLGKLIHLEFYRIVFFRMVIAGLSLLFFLWIRKKRFLIKDRRSLLKVIGVGVIVLLHWLTFYKAIQVSSVSLGVLCLSTTALHVSWLEPLIMRRKFSWMEFGLGLLVIVAVMIVTSNIDGSQMAGLFWGLLSALLSASFAVFNARLNKDGIPSSSITLYEMLTGALILLVGLSLNGNIDATFFQMSMSDFWWLVFLGIICTSLAFILMIDAVAKIGAYSATLTVNLEPVYSIILAIIILQEDEMLNRQFYIGVLFILLVVFSNPMIKSFQAKRKRKLALHNELR